MKYFKLFCLIIVSQFLSAQKADLIIYNAIIYNHENTNSDHDAIAIKDGLILKTGAVEDLNKLKTAETQLIDAKGNFLMPGFIEGHGHFHSTGKANLNLNLNGTKNWDEIIELVKKEVDEALPGEFINGRGWHQEKWDKSPENTILGFPYHDKLSAVSPDNPIVLRHASGHVLIANQKAMDLAGIDKNTLSPPGGEIFKDKNGKPTGIFNETASDLLRPAYEKSQKEQSDEENWAYWLKCVEKAEDICLKNGISSFQDAGSEFTEIVEYRKLAATNDLDIRLWVMLIDDIEKISSELGKHINNFDNMYFKLGGIKAYIDGALGSHGAWLLEPYDDNPHSHGHRIISEKDFDTLGKLCKQYDLQLCTHAIGDRGNRVVFNTYEKWLDGKDRRWRIEHAQHLHPDELIRFTKLGIIAAMQPNHCTSDAPFVEKRLGKKRAEEGAYVWRKILNTGAKMNLGTDTPVEDLNPLKNIYAACTRIIPAKGQSFYPDQKLSREEALYYYTQGNAYSVFQEDSKGSLEQGKLADIIILDKNLLTCEDKDLLEANVLYTLIDGKIKYQMNASL